MMKSIQGLDAAAMSAFAATLGDLPGGEIAKAKRLYVRNAIADYEDLKRSGKAMLIVMGVMSLIPIFLIVFIPSLIAYRSSVRTGRQKILNALDVWKDDLGDDYEMLKAQLAD